MTLYFERHVSLNPNAEQCCVNDQEQEATVSCRAINDLEGLDIDLFELFGLLKFLIPRYSIQNFSFIEFDEVGSRRLGTA